MTVSDPHSAAHAPAPLTRRALRTLRDRSVATDPVQAAGSDAAWRAGHEDPAPTLPLELDALRRADAAVDAPAHPPIFKPPPPPRHSRPTPATAAIPVPLIEAGESAAARHARRRPIGWGSRLAIAAASLLVVTGGAAVAAWAGSTPEPAPQTLASADITGSQVQPFEAASTPAATRGTMSVTDPAVRLPRAAAPASLALCDTPAFATALASGDDAAAIAAAGGGAQFRIAVATGAAPCVSLADPARTWVLIDKLRPFHPLRYAPSPLKLPADLRSVEGSPLRVDAADALTRMVRAAASAGAGQIALESGYRSYQTQEGSYGRQVGMRGTAKADLVSARPGYSEHQTGLAGDMVACTDGRCGTLDDLAGSAQGHWIVQHAWQYGWIVRYQKGQTGVTGYLPEPWHLRYIGTDLAKAYHDGGFHTLEEFFGLPPAPDYAD
ncbi:hypothetical protein GCM10022240_00920 [Microbacterium kribbense]|uniref:D-alanyl-D-alanine carboxypeptidase-like core domain-containing protein n=1 Tax=Microbacterium kribbense TaxID=433645 RepID=A0ABP7FYB7_9MICO